MMTVAALLTLILQFLIILQLTKKIINKLSRINKN